MPTIKLAKAFHWANIACIVFIVIAINDGKVRMLLRVLTRGACAGWVVWAHTGERNSSGKQSWADSRRTRKAGVAHAAGI